MIARPTVGGVGVFVAVSDDAADCMPIQVVDVPRRSNVDDNEWPLGPTSRKVRKRITP